METIWDVHMHVSQVLVRQQLSKLQGQVTGD